MLLTGDFSILCEHKKTRAFLLWLNSVPRALLPAPPSDAITIAQNAIKVFRDFPHFAPYCPLSDADFVKFELVLPLEAGLKAQAKKRQGQRNDLKNFEENLDQSECGERTRENLAKTSPAFSRASMLPFPALLHGGILECGVSGERRNSDLFDELVLTSVSKFPIIYVM